MRIILPLILCCICISSCNRENLYAGKRLDVFIDIEYLYLNRGAIAFAGYSSGNDLWIPMPNLGSCSDPRAALIGVGICLSVGIIVSVSSEIIGIVKNGRTSFGKTVYSKMELRILCNGITYKATIGPGHNRIELTEELEKALKLNDAIFNIFADGNLAVNKSIRIWKLSNPGRSVIRFLGDGHVFIDEEFVE